MTPGMMNLGVPGVVAVGSNMTHKFGKAMMGSRKHARAGQRRQAHGRSSSSSRRSSGSGSRCGSTAPCSRAARTATAPAARRPRTCTSARSSSASSRWWRVSMLRDALRTASEDETPGRPCASPTSSPAFTCPPTSTSRWRTCGYRSGCSWWWSGHRVPGGDHRGGRVHRRACMIYVFGVPTAVAAGTELYLAMFMGALGALQLRLPGHRGHPH